MPGKKQALTTASMENGTILVRYKNKNTYETNRKKQHINESMADE